MNLASIAKLFQDGQNIALIGHVVPDGDTIGSCLALGHALRKLEKNVDLYCEDELPDKFSFLDGAESFCRFVNEKKEYDIVAALDCSDMSRLGKCGILMEVSPCTVNIDHHISNTCYAKVNFVDQNAAATGEIIFELIRLLVKDLDLSIAKALYTAISTDTGSFCFSNTTPRTHRIVADLLEYGVDVDRISTLLFRSTSVEKTLLLSMVLNTLKFHFNKKVATLYVTQEMMKKSGVKSYETEGIIKFAEQITGVELAILFKEIGEQTKVSFRSKSSIDVNKLAQKFGGGGHKKASGCTINADIKEAERKVINEIERILGEMT